MNSGFLNFIFYFIRGVCFTSKAPATIYLGTLDFVLYPSISWYSIKNTITSKCSGLLNKFETLLHPFKHTKKLWKMDSLSLSTLENCSLYF